MRGTVNRVAMMYLVLLMGLGLADMTVAVEDKHQVRTVPVVPSIQTTWAVWRGLHPETKVWIAED